MLAAEQTREREGRRLDGRSISACRSVLLPFLRQAGLVWLWLRRPRKQVREGCSVGVCLFTRAVPSLGLPCSPLLLRGPFDEDASCFYSSTTTTFVHSSSSLRVVFSARIDLPCSDASLHTRAATPFLPLSLPRSDPLLRPFVAQPSTRPTRRPNYHGHPSETGQELQESADFGQEEGPGGEGWDEWGGRIERGRAAGWSSSSSQAGRKPPHALCSLLPSRPRG